MENIIRVPNVDFLDSRFDLGRVEPIEGEVVGQLEIDLDKLGVDSVVVEVVGEVIEETD